MQRCWTRPLQTYEDFRRAIDTRVIRAPSWWSVAHRHPPLFSYVRSKDNASRLIAFREDKWRADYHKLFPQELQLYPQTIGPMSEMAGYKRPVDKFIDRMKELVDVRRLDYLIAFKQSVQERHQEERVNELERAVAEHQAVTIYGMKEKSAWARQTYEAAKIASYRTARAAVIRRRFYKIRFLIQHHMFDGPIRQEELRAFGITAKDLTTFVKANPDKAQHFHPDCFFEGNDAADEVLAAFRKAYLASSSGLFDGTPEERDRIQGELKNDNKKPWTEQFADKQQNVAPLSKQAQAEEEAARKAKMAKFTKTPEEVTPEEVAELKKQRRSTPPDLPILDEVFDELLEGPPVDDAEDGEEPTIGSIIGEGITDVLKFDQAPDAPDPPDAEADENEREIDDLLSAAYPNRSYPLSKPVAAAGLLFETMAALTFEDTQEDHKQYLSEFRPVVSDMLKEFKTFDKANSVLRLSSISRQLAHVAETATPETAEALISQITAQFGDATPGTLSSDNKSSEYVPDSPTPDLSLPGTRKKLAAAFGVEQKAFDSLLTDGVDYELQSQLSRMARAMDKQKDNKLNMDSILYQPTRSPSEIVSEASKGQSARYREQLTSQVNEALTEEYEMLRAESEALFADKKVSDTMKKLVDYAAKHKWSQAKLRAVQETMIGRLLEQKLELTHKARTPSMDMLEHAKTGAPIPEQLAEVAKPTDEEIAASKLADDVMVAFHMPVSAEEAAKTPAEELAKMATWRTSSTKRGVESIAPLLDKFAEVAFNAKKSRNAQLNLARQKLGGRRTETDNEAHVREIIANKQIEEYTHDDWQALQYSMNANLAEIEARTGIDFNNPSLLAGLGSADRAAVVDDILKYNKPKDAVELVRAPQFYASPESELFGEFKLLMDERPEVYDYVKKAYNPAATDGKASGAKSVDPIEALFKDFASKLKAKGL